MFQLQQKLEIDADVIDSLRSDLVECESRLAAFKTLSAEQEARRRQELGFVLEEKRGLEVELAKMREVLAHMGGRGEVGEVGVDGEVGGEGGRGEGQGGEGEPDDEVPPPYSLHHHPHTTTASTVTATATATAADAVTVVSTPPTKTHKRGVSEVVDDPSSRPPVPPHSPTPHTPTRLGLSVSAVSMTHLQEKNLQLTRQLSLTKKMLEMDKSEYEQKIGEGHEKWEQMQRERGEES